MQESIGKSNPCGLRRWQHPKKSGIVIREVMNRNARGAFGISFQVIVPAKITGTNRERKNFADKLRAEGHAETRFQEHRNRGRSAFVLTHHEHGEAIKAAELLRPHGIGLVEAARVALKHLRPPSGDITVAELGKRFIQAKELRNLRPRSLADLRTRVNALASRFGERLAKEVAATDLEAWIDEQRGLAQAHRTLRNTRDFARAIFAFAVERGFSGANPAERLDAPVVDWKPPVILSIAQARNFLTTARDNPDLKLLGYVVLAMFAGVRSAELARLDWRDVDLVRRHVSISASIAKKRRNRTIDLPANAVDWLLTVPSRTGAIAPAKLDRKFAKLARLAGFVTVDEAGKEWSAWRAEYRNALRHTAASMHYAKHRDSALTSALLGHKNDEQLFAHYRHVATPEDAEAFYALTPATIDAASPIAAIG